MSHRTMSAAVLYGREDLRLEEIAVPGAGPGEVVLRVGAALTCGTDLKVYRRGYHAAMGRPPMLFGHELAGTVVEVGAGVTRFTVGDRVVPMNSAPCGACFFVARVSRIFAMICCSTMGHMQIFCGFRRGLWRRTR